MDDTMEVISLASGSSGNATFIKCNNETFLIDIGVSYSYAKTLLSDTYGEALDSIDALFITHRHTDHIKGLKTLIKHIDCPIYYLDESIPSKYDYNFFIRIDNYKKGDFKTKFEFVPLSHDVVNYGMIIDDKLVYITDTGYINKKYFPKLKNKSVYMIEANYDDDMLMNGFYPADVKLRIASNTGHLSNSDCNRYLHEFIEKDSPLVMLMHLSENNNSPDLALSEVKKGFSKEQADNFMVYFDRVYL